MDASTTKPRRKRGGQPGNTNALRHGFYSRKFHAGDLEDLESGSTASLEDEIAMLRVSIRRVFDFASENADDLDEWWKTLAVLGAASTKLASLMRTEQALAGQRNAAAAALSQALSEVIQEMEEERRKEQA